VPAADDRARLEKLMRKQLRNFTTLLAKVLADEDADAVHDLRVCTRRLQQSIATLAPAKDLSKARLARRTLRRTRHALGEWRDCDVALQRIGRSERRALNPHRRRGWELVHQMVAGERKRAVSKARRRLLKADGFTLTHRTQQLLALPADRLGNIHPDVTVRAAVADAAGGWREALAQAMTDRSVQSIHGLRIQMKRLRYRIELARDLGADEARPVIQWFKSLQDRLGRWHDRHELSGYIAQALANSEVLLDQPRAGAEMLKEIEKDAALGRREVDEFFQLAVESEGRGGLDAWLKAYCETAFESPPAAAPTNNSESGQPLAQPPEPRQAEPVQPAGPQPEQEAEKPQR
jgi:CHAD domain-containing protein